MSGRYELPSELTIYGVQAAREALLAWITEQETTPDTPLDISARNVEEIDGSGLQLLAALSNSTHAWRLIEASNAFASACRTLGFEQWLAIPHAMAHDRKGAP